MKQQPHNSWKGTTWKNHLLINSLHQKICAPCFLILCIFLQQKGWRERGGREGGEEEERESRVSRRKRGLERGRVKVLEEKLRSSGGTDTSGLEDGGQGTRETEDAGSREGDLQTG